MSLPPMTPLMTVGMVLFMIVFMILLMFAIHVMRTNHLRRHGKSSHGSSSLLLSILNWVIKALLRIGIRITILGPIMLLTVRGRKTGEPRTIPVDLYERDDRHFLIATHGEGNWVRNLRVAHEGSLSLGRYRQSFTSVELAPELAGPVIKEFLGPLLASQGIRGNVLRQHLGVSTDSSLDDFITVAKTHPVFELNFINELATLSEEYQRTNSHSISESI